jgi:hypothetical protein
LLQVGIEFSSQAPRQLYGQLLPCRPDPLEPDTVPLLPQIQHLSDVKTRDFPLQWGFPQRDVFVLAPACAEATEKESDGDGVYFHGTEILIKNTKKAETLSTGQKADFGF